MNRIPPILRTIPSDDDGFRELVLQLAARITPQGPTELGTRLRRLFPRVLVRERQLSSEPLTWYVYRDGAWSHLTDPTWWHSASVARLTISTDGWICEANPSAQELLGIDQDEVGARHVTDFVAPGTLEDASQLFDIVARGHALMITALLKPCGRDVVACELHAERVGGQLVSAQLRLSDPVSVPAEVVDRPNALACVPESDLEFASYARLLLDRMPEPTVEGLCLRLCRRYPFSTVSVDGDHWLVVRGAVAQDAPDRAAVADLWWIDPAVPPVS